MNTVRWFCTVLNAAMIVSMFTSCGCSQTQPPPPQPNDATPPIETTVTPIAVREMDLPVKEGSMPLAYLIETTGGVRVVDMTANRPLARTTAPGRTIVSVDEQRGVSIGGIIYAVGPLPADHRYGVYVDSGGLRPEEDMQQTTERNDPSILHKHSQSTGNQSSDNQSSGKRASGTTTGPSPHN